ncbi:hypothetical protein AAFX91_29575 [Bradyrhizobium sp. 31Argb]|uniref:hypothetical protein n=1 Tax=unclassified Bradyrhizobium TaxID=2631580 RepID=UPI0032B753E3
MMSEQWLSRIPAITSASVQIIRKMGKKPMRNKLIAATAMAFIAYAAIPAHAAKVTVGCSGDNLAKTESAVETMADGPGKIVAQKEIAQAQDALLGGKMGVCAAHLNKAMHAGEAK